MQQLSHSDWQKYPGNSLYDAGLPSTSAPPTNNFLEPGLSHLDKERDLEKHQPKATHYLTTNCVLFTYFSGDTATSVDEHFSRALSQPSSYTLDKPTPNNKPFTHRAGQYTHRVVSIHT